MLCRVKMKSEQVNLESFAEAGEWFCSSDIGLKFVPLLRCHILKRVATSLSELCLHSGMAVPASWCSRAKCSRRGVWPDQCLVLDGCSSVDGLESQHHRLESDAGRNRKPVEVTEEGGRDDECDLPPASVKKYLACFQEVIHVNYCQQWIFFTFGTLS